MDPLEPTVVCRGCGLTNTRGTLKCTNCGAFLPGNPNAWKEQPADAPKNAFLKRDENLAKEWAKRSGLDWNDLDPSMQLIITAGIDPKAPAADRAMLLRQMELLKPAPKVGKDKGADEVAVFVQAESVENAKKALATLKEIIRGKEQGE